MRAIVFDFFGTLTDPAAELERRAALAETAGVLAVPADRFWTVMSRSFTERITGVHGGTRTTLLEMARRCGVEPTERQLDAAVVAHLAGAERVRRPRNGVLKVLDDLRASGFRLGVLSDCSSELCEVWGAMVFAPLVDAAIFSWREGHRKPDGRLYAAVAGRLGVTAAQCWFVGDGGSREHQGARSAGMRPVLVTNAGYPGATALRDDPDSFVPELVIDDLFELKALVGRSATTRRREPHRPQAPQWFDAPGRLARRRPGAWLFCLPPLSGWDRLG
jgi:putative hydrolase of the HAD superfamily